MAIKMIIFEYRESEKNFFKENKLENFDITFIQDSLNDETVNNLTEEQLNNTSVISVFLDSEVTKNVIDSFKNLRIISTRSSSISHINHKAAVDKNIDVINIDNYGAKSVAQFTIGLIISLVRQIVPASQSIRNNTCKDFVGRDLSQLTLGVVGTGSIGANVCKLAKAFGMKVIAHDIIERTEFSTLLEIEYVDLYKLIRESDIITLHIAYRNDNYKLFSEKQFDLMKQSAFLINTSKGEIVNTNDLYNALADKKIGGAALDVVPCEKYSIKCEELSQKLGTDMTCMTEAETVAKLSELPNVIITPRIAYETQDAINYSLKMTFRGIIDCIKGGSKYKNM